MTSSLTPSLACGIKGVCDSILFAEEDEGGKTALMRGGGIVFCLLDLWSWVAGLGAWGLIRVRGASLSICVWVIRVLCCAMLCDSCAGTWMVRYRYRVEDYAATIRGLCDYDSSWWTSLDEVR